LRVKAGADKLIYKEEKQRIKDLLWEKKQEARVRKDGGLDQEINQLREQIGRLKEQGYASRMDAKKLRIAVKSQSIRRQPNPYEQGLIQEMATSDPWKTRVPNMQKLFPVHHTKIRSIYESAVTQIFSDPATAIEKLQHYLDEVIVQAKPTPHAIDFVVFEGILKAISEKINFEALLNILIRDQQLIKMVASESYHHDLFDKLVLLSGPKSGYKLRMHVFLPNTFSLAQEEVHSHRNHFVSRVIHGGMTQGVWEESIHYKGEIQPQTFFKYIYDPLLMPDGTRVFNINPCGQINLTRVDQATINAPSTYYMHPSVLHSVESLDGYTVTLVLNSSQSVDKSCFATLEPWKDESFVRQRFSEEEVTNQLNFVLGLISKPEASMEVEPETH